MQLISGCFITILFCAISTSAFSLDLNQPLICTNAAVKHLELPDDKAALEKLDDICVTEYHKDIAHITGTDEDDVWRRTAENVLLERIRIHTKLGRLTPDDLALPEHLSDASGIEYTGIALSLLAKYYKGKDNVKFEQYLLKALDVEVEIGTNASKSELNMESDGEEAIFMGIDFYLKRNDFSAVDRLISVLPTPRPKDPYHIDLYDKLASGDNAAYTRPKLEKRIETWNTAHNPSVGRIAFEVATAYAALHENENYGKWLIVSENNDYSQASLALDEIFIKSQSNIADALMRLGFGNDLIGSDGSINQSALDSALNDFGHAALGGSADSSYTISSDFLITKLRKLASQTQRVPAEKLPGVGIVTTAHSQGTGFLAGDRCTVVTAEHMLGDHRVDIGDLVFSIPTLNFHSQFTLIANGISGPHMTDHDKDWIVGHLETCAPAQSTVYDVQGIEQKSWLIDKDGNAQSSNDQYKFFWAVGFPGGSSIRGITVTKCELDEIANKGLYLKDTCLVHGMSGGPIFLADPTSGSTHVIATNTALDEYYLTENASTSNAVTATQRGVGTLSSAFDDAVWRASHEAKLAKDEQEAESKALSSTGGEANYGGAIVYIFAHIDSYLKNYIDSYLVDDRVTVSEFLDLVNHRNADVEFIGRKWCSSVGTMTFTAMEGEKWRLAFKTQPLLGMKVMFGDGDLRGSYEAEVRGIGDIVVVSYMEKTDDNSWDSKLILRKRDDSLYLIGKITEFGMPHEHDQMFWHLKFSSGCENSRAN